MKHIAKLSGGRDSTAMVFYMLQHKMPLDHIIFNDTQAEFPEMYEYLDRVDLKLADYGHKIIRLQHKRNETFEDWVFGKITRGKKKGIIRGLPMTIQKCYWQREAKVYPFEKWMTDKEFNKCTIYIGYTYSEKKRSQVKATNQRYPLIELKKCEADVDRKLLELDLVNPLYANFERTGCYFCPYQKLRGFYLLWKLHPKQWDYMHNLENTLNALMDGGVDVLNPQWNIRYTMDEMTEAFSTGEILFEVESPQACECKI